MSKPPTVIDPEDWWRDIFSETEFTILERIFGNILAAEQDNQDERIEIEITVKPEAYAGMLLKLIGMYGENNALDDIIEDLCTMYMDDDRIVRDLEIEMFLERVARDNGENDDD